MLRSKRWKLCMESRQLPGTTVPQKTKKEFEGNLTLVVFPFLKASHKAPEATAQEIGEYLLANEPAVAFVQCNQGLSQSGDRSLRFGARCCITSTKRPISGRIKLPVRCSFGHGRIFLAQYQQTVTFETSIAQRRWDIVFPRFWKPMAIGWWKPISSMTEVFISVNRCWLGKNGATVSLPKRPEKGDHLIGDFYVLFDKHYKQELKELEAKRHDPRRGRPPRRSCRRPAPCCANGRPAIPRFVPVWEMNNWVYADSTRRIVAWAWTSIRYITGSDLSRGKKVLEGLEKGIMYRKEDGSVWKLDGKRELNHKLLLRSDGTSVAWRRTSVRPSAFQRFPHR